MSKDKPVKSVAPPTSVNIKKANNGFVVSRWDDRRGREQTFIAKSNKEALRLTTKLLKK